MDRLLQTYEKLLETNTQMLKTLTPKGFPAHLYDNVGFGLGLCTQAYSLYTNNVITEEAKDEFLADLREQMAYKCNKFLWPMTNEGYLARQEFILKRIAELKGE